MSLLSKEQVDENFGGSRSLEPGQKADVVITSYEPFFYGENKDKKMPKYLAFNAATSEQLEFVGFRFHEEIKKVNDRIEPTVTVLEVECVDNGSKYPDYSIKVKEGGIKPSEEQPFE